MSDVLMPQRQGPAQTVVPLAGQAAGSYFGGPIGGMVGGMVGQRLAGGQKQPAPVQSAIQRRIETQTPQPSPMQDLQAADQALAQMPPEMQKQYSPALRRAMQLEAQQRGMA